MNKIIFISGGARSGKSTYALEIAKKAGAKQTAFIATCEPLDEEMSRRIKLHKKTRPSGWKTYEEPLDIAKALSLMKDKYKVIIIDCITLLVSNLLLKGHEQKDICGAMDEMLEELKNKDAMTIVVSNEVGLGIVPENKLARDFRDIAGKVNQIIAKESDEAYFMVSGIPWRVK